MDMDRAIIMKLG